VTGANRGIGRALVEEALSRGAKQVYAGFSLDDDLSDRAPLEQQLAVNLFGTYGVTRAFLPLLNRSRGAIVNVGSVTAWAAIPVIPAYSISKAAAFSMSQSQSWRNGAAKALERQYAALVETGPVTS
jgi:NAD(P)-dependent dehydrogenase (short-subunit alcohol dehydrogenase family)